MYDHRDAIWQKKKEQPLENGYSKVYMQEEKVGVEGKSVFLCG